jgi:hypothetical protein
MNFKGEQMLRSLPITDQKRKERIKKADINSCMRSNCIQVCIVETLTSGKYQILGTTKP